MDEVKEIVERIRDLPRSGVDVGFLRERDRLVVQIRQAGLKPDPAWLERAVNETIETLRLLKEKAKPHIVPEEYLFFLGAYGGLYIERDNFYFSVYGLGVMSEDWYASVVSDSAMLDWATENGFLKLGHLNFREGEFKSHYIDYLLDLAGNVSRNNVIAVGPYRSGPGSDVFVEDIHQYPGPWRVVANSFTGWLRRIAETEGSFGYDG